MNKKTLFKILTAAGAVITGLGIFKLASDKDEEELVDVDECCEGEEDVDEEIDEAE